MEVSPFPHHGPLDPAQVVTRSDLVDDLVRRVSERRVTALLGPRRFGKTTALRAVVERLGDATTPVWLDLYALASWEDLAIRLDDSMASLDTRGSSLLSELAIRAQLPLGGLSVELSKPASKRPDAMAIVHAQLKVLVEAARRQPVVLVIDEFSGIVGVPNAAARLRTALQHHFQEIGLLFAGSEPSTMLMLFTDRAEPFYAQADLVETEPFDLATVDAILQVGFESTGRKAGPIAAAVHTITEGHPHRVMELADAVWSVVDPGGTADDDAVRRGFGDVMASTASGLERLFSSFAGSEQLVLRVLARRESLFGAYADSLGLSNGGAQHARDSLIDRGHVRRVDGVVSIVDPILAEWARRRF